MTDDEIREKVSEFSQRLDGLWQRFEGTAVRTDPDLFDPDRFEVLTGITARALRIVTVSIDSPPSWTPEHSAPLIRAMIESLITIRWLLHRDNPEIFRRFKEFGRGHLKLLKLHLEEYTDALADPPKDLVDQISHLNLLVNEDLGEEYQDIHLGGTFAGIDMRKMAYEVGLESEYRLVLAPSSADFHGEWSHLSRYALTVCGTLSHRFHRIPRQEIQPHINPSIVATTLEYAERIVDEYTNAIVS